VRARNREDPFLMITLTWTDAMIFRKRKIPLEQCWQDGRADARIMKRRTELQGATPAGKLKLVDPDKGA